MNQNVLQDLGVTIQRHASLSDATTFRLGGHCPFLFSCATPDLLEAAVQFCLNAGLPFLLIGGGSNLLVSDNGIQEAVIRYHTHKPLIVREGNDLIVSGSTLLDDLVCHAIDAGLEGMTHLSGIPGTVGGAVVGNAGAFGRQIGDVVVSAETICRDTSNPVFAVIDIPAKDMNFSYRYSRFKDTDGILLSARFSLKPADKPSLQKERREILALRKEKHPQPEDHPCAGSFFRNIESTSDAGKREAAGRFLEQAGAKDMHVGGARVFDRHANIIYKADGCRAQDVYDLSVKMAGAVKQKFGLDLVREVRLVGKFDGMPEGVAETVW